MDDDGNHTWPGASLVETHISTLVFLGDRAWKLKKPVKLGFLDFSTRELRLEACRAEVAVNRRLAPDVYLGVADVTGPDGELCDHLVAMRRMPEDRRLAALVVADPHGAATRAGVDGVADRLAAFHRTAKRSPEIDQAGRAESVLRVWEDDLAEMAPHVGTVLDAAMSDRVAERARTYLAGRQALIDERVIAGWMRDGHGDLQADDIFLLDDGPRILDAVEFDEHLRWDDVLADAAFLAMDLERLGAPHLAQRFVARWSQRLGTPVSASLLDHHVARRAHVRAKVMTLRAVQADPGSVERQQAIDGARTFLGLCDRHLDRARVRLVLLGGAPGTGTTTAARTLCDRAGWGLLRSDVLRRDPVDGTAPADGSPVRTGVLDDGTYDPADVQRTYGVLLDRAGAMLARGASVVLDASWSQARQRAAARALAQRHHAELVELRTVAPLDVATERVRARHASGLDESDATPALTLELTRRFEPWPEATELDTAAPSESLWQRALFEATGCSAVADLPRWDTPPDA